MRFHQWWLQNNPPEDDASTQTTQPIPTQAPPITPERRRALAAKPNCVLCLAEHAEMFGLDAMEFEAGGYGLCIDCAEWVEAQPLAVRQEIIAPYLQVLYRRFDPQAG